MDLDEYLWKTRAHKKKFSMKIQTEPTNLYLLTKKIHSPNLCLALRIHHVSNGEITLEELLSVKDREIFNEFKKKESANED